MSTSQFPVSLDTYQNPTATNTTNSPSLSYGQTIQNDSLAALETKVGVTSSLVTSSLDYKVSNTSSVDPGHKHTASTLSLASNSIPASVLTNNSVAQAQMGTLSVGTAQLIAGSVTNNVLAPQSVQSSNASLTSGSGNLASSVTISSSAVSNLTGFSFSIAPTYAFKVFVWGVFDITSSVSFDAYVASLQADGVTQTGQAIFIGAASGDRKTISQNWVLTLSSGSHRFQFQASRSSGSGNGLFSQTHTSYSYLVISQ